MSVPCTICQHPRYTHLERLLRPGTRTYESIAAEVGCSAQALRRHVRSRHAERNGHAVPSLPPPPEAAPEPPDDTPAGKLRALLARLERADTSRMTPSAAVHHAESMRRVLESIARVEGPSSAPEVVRMEDVEGLVALFSDLWA